MKDRVIGLGLTRSKAVQFLVANGVSRKKALSFSDDILSMHYFNARQFMRVVE